MSQLQNFNSMFRLDGKVALVTGGTSLVTESLPAKPHHRNTIEQDTKQLEIVLLQVLEDWVYTPQPLFF
jgi:hypothetical protein